MRIGDTVLAKPVAFGERNENGAKVAMPGTVIYIHPRGRFCTLEFTVGHGSKLKESFMMYGGRMVR